VGSELPKLRAFRKNYYYVAIPHGGLGTRKSSKKRLVVAGSVVVTIPPSGLRTGSTAPDWFENFLFPSHAVGLELLPLFLPSLAISGLHPTQWARKLINVRFTLSSDSVPFPIAIPHSGLKTSPKKLENQNFNPLKIETAHREGTLTHIQLPS
jgi:hypothetical protein